LRGNLNGSELLDWRLFSHPERSCLFVVVGVEEEVEQRILALG